MEAVYTYIGPDRIPHHYALKFETVAPMNITSSEFMRLAPQGILLRRDFEIRIRTVDGNTVIIKNTGTVPMEMKHQRTNKIVIIPSQVSDVIILSSPSSWSREDLETWFDKTQSIKARTGYKGNMFLTVSIQERGCNPAIIYRADARGHQVRNQRI